MNRETGGKRVIAVALVLIGSTFLLQEASGQRIGVGAHYWRTVDTLPDEFDRDGISYRLTYQNSLTALTHYQIDLERFDRSFAGSDKPLYAPQAMLLLGRVIYGGVGIGILYSDGDFAKRPFYLLRAGLDISLLPRLRLDVNANYHFSEWRGVQDIAGDINSDTITVGAALRLAL